MNEIHPLDYSGCLFPAIMKPMSRLVEPAKSPLAKVFIRLCAKFCVSWSERALYHKVGSQQLRDIVGGGVLKDPNLKFRFMYKWGKGPNLEIAEQRRQMGPINSIRENRF